MKSNIMAGLVTAVLMVAATISYSAAIFSGPLAGQLQVGIGYGLIGACVTAVVFALFSEIPFAIAGPDSKPTAILTVMTASVASTVAVHGQADTAGAMALLSLLIGTLLTGVILLVFGAIKMGRWVRFVPYPVIGGFMAASGWLLMEGAVRILTRIHPTPENLPGILQPPRILQLLAGIGFSVAIALISKRSNSPLAVPALLLGGGGITHLGLRFAGMSVAQAQDAGWLLNVPGGVVVPVVWLYRNLHHADPGVILRLAGDYAALVVVTAITLLLSVTAIEVDTQMAADLDVDRELRINGYANLAAALFGGMTGTMSLSRTLFNFQNGGTRRLSGIVAAGGCLATLVFGTGLLGYTPVPVLGGMLLRLGWDMVNEWVLRGWKRLTAPDYAQVIIILVAIVAWGFLAGISVGVLAACVTFAVNSSRIRIVKLELNRSKYASRLDRSPAQNRELILHGDGIRIMWLHGFIFFGSANRLLLHVKELVAAQEAGGCRMVLLAFNEVLGIDTSAVMSLVKLRQFTERASVILVLAGLPPKVEHSLRAGGFLRDDDPHCRVFAQLDPALEWCEDRLLEERANRDETFRSADEWLIREIGGRELLDQLFHYVERVELAAGEMLFHQGESGDHLCLVYSGRVSVLFRPYEGKEIRIRSMMQQTMVGEMGIYRMAPRGASVTVDEPTVILRLTREAMDRMEADNPPLAYAFHKFVIRTLAERLDFANREVAALQR